jgi:hypothetical protein
MQVNLLVVIEGLNHFKFAAGCSDCALQDVKLERFAHFDDFEMIESLTAVLDDTFEEWL